MFPYIIYAVAGIIHAISDYSGIDALKYTSKIALMPVLAYIVYKAVFPYKKLLLCALFFSWLGDIFLVLPLQSYPYHVQQLLFSLGLVSFLMAHIFYITLFFKETGGNFRTSALAKNPFLVIPFLIYTAVLIYLLFPYLGVLKLPVAVYATVLTLMALSAFNRRDSVLRRSFHIVLVGAVLFVLSDSGIALSAFYKNPSQQIKNTSWNMTFIIVTYVAAQALIVRGLTMNYFSKNKQKM
jgi:uncharacterized membrane protein YhhN